MLAVNLDQGGADLAQGRDPCGLVVDIGPAAAVGVQHAAQDQVLARLDLESLFGDQGQQVGIVRGAEDGGGHGLFGPVAHQAGVAAPAQGQTQGVQNDRLARPRLARQHGQAGLDVEIQHVDQDDVADGKGGQHGRTRFGMGRSLARGGVKGIRDRRPDAGRR